MPQVPWEVGYEFTHDGAIFEWVLASRAGTTGIIRADESLVDLATTPPLILPAVLLGQQSTDRPFELPPSMDPFTIDRLCPRAGQLISAPIVRTGAGVVDQQLLPFRQAIELLGLPTPDMAPNQAYSLAYVLLPGVENADGCGVVSADTAG